MPHAFDDPLIVGTSHFVAALTEYFAHVEMVPDELEIDLVEILDRHPEFREASTEIQDYARELCGMFARNVAIYQREDLPWDEPSAG